MTVHKAHPTQLLWFLERWYFLIVKLEYHRILFHCAYSSMVRAPIFLTIKRTCLDLDPKHAPDGRDR